MFGLATESFSFIVMSIRCAVNGELSFVKLCWLAKFLDRFFPEVKLNFFHNQSHIFIYFISNVRICFDNVSHITAQICGLGYSFQ